MDRYRTKRELHLKINKILTEDKINTAWNVKIKNKSNCKKKTQTAGRFRILGHGDWASGGLQDDV